MSERVNTVELWASLSDEAKNEIGSRAIATALAIMAHDEAGIEADVEVVAAFYETQDELLEKVEQLWPRGARGTRPALLPDLNVLGVRQCEVCGCTDNCGCHNGCTWVGEKLCSNCGKSESGHGRTILTCVDGGAA